MAIRVLGAVLAIISLLLFVACYRATGIPRNQVSAFQATTENTDILPTGTEVTSRLGDYILQSSHLQLIFDGDLNSSNRQLYGIDSAGAIIDASSRYVDLFSRLQTRSDDGVNLISQGVNLNPQTPVIYRQIQVDEIDEVNAGLILTGDIYDFDGSLQAQGAAVDTSTRRVLDCTVTTRLALIDSIEEEIEDTDGDGVTETTSIAVRYVTMTSVVQNHAMVDLPVFSVHDHVVTKPAASDVFIPYPEFGFSRELGRSHLSDIAYPPYVTVRARQADTAHYAWVSQMDALLSATILSDQDQDLEHTFIGKVGKPGDLVPPGGELSFIREFFVFSSSYTAEQLYDSVVELLRDSDSPLNLFTTTGDFRAAFAFENAPGGQLEVAYVDGANLVYDGSNFGPVTSETPFPIFGFRDLDSLVTLFVPPGRLVLDVQAANSAPEVREVAVSERTNEDGDEFLLERQIVVQPDEIFDFGLASMAEQHYVGQIGLTNTDERRLQGRFRILPKSGQQVSLGDFPSALQGDMGYITGSGVSISLPADGYDIYLSHGPLHNVNVFDVDVVSSVDEDAVTTTFITPGTVQAQMNPSVDWPGFLSADFGLRSAGDATGMLPKDELLLFAAAEDLDVAFFSDVTTQPQIELTFEAVAALQGGFDEEDAENDVESLKDELAVSRCVATIGTPTSSYPQGRGKFSLLNLPSEDEVDYINVPLVETDPPEFFDAARQIDDQILIHLMRPRAPLTAKIGLFSAIAAYSGLEPGQSISADNPYLNRSAANGSSTTWLDFDLIQILPGKHYDEYLMARSDWFNLLNAGVFKPATGGSTAGETKDLPVGVVRTWVAVSDTTLRDNELDEFWTNAAAGRMFVSNGPLIDANVNGASYGETTSVGSEFNVRIRILAAPWIPVPEVRIVLDGEVVETLSTADEGESETVRFNRDVTLTLDEGGDHWIVIEAGVSIAYLAEPEQAPPMATFGIVNPGHLPIAFTNPIFLNASGP